SLLLPILPPSRSTLFPYTTLFRSPATIGNGCVGEIRFRRCPREFRHRSRFGPLQGRIWFLSIEPLKRGDAHSGIHEHVMNPGIGDRKSTRLNSSHLVISYAVFCLK